MPLKKALQKDLLKNSSKSQTDKWSRYIRYVDDFIIGVCGSKEECQEIKRRLSEFIGKTLKMELFDKKMFITHSNAKTMHYRL